MSAAEVLRLDPEFSRVGALAVGSYCRGAVSVTANTWTQCKRPARWVLDPGPGANPVPYCTQHAKVIHDARRDANLAPDAGLDEQDEEDCGCIRAAGGVVVRPCEKHRKT